MTIPTLVDPEISRQKLRGDVERWQANALHRKRGWILLQYSEEQLCVELAFLARVSINSGSGPLPIVVCAVRLTYENYDLWAPSLTFIDAFTRDPAMPHVRAFKGTPLGHRDLLINGHPDTGRPFLCVPGVREYHTHPQHTGDNWLLYRERGDGTISTICDRLWRFMARNVIGVRLQVQTLPTWPLQAQIQITLSQGDIDAPGTPGQAPSAENGGGTNEPETVADENQDLHSPIAPGAAQPAQP